MDIQFRPLTPEEVEQQEAYDPEYQLGCQCLEPTGAWFLSFDCGSPGLKHEECGREIWNDDWYPNTYLDDVEVHLDLGYQSCVVIGPSGALVEPVLTVHPATATDLTTCSCACGDLDPVWLLGMDVGCATTLKHRPCGAEPPVDDWIYYMDVPESIKVTRTVETCGDLGGWHGLVRCDCDWFFQLTPVTAES
jgi:hypothetical protein